MSTICAFDFAQSKKGRKLAKYARIDQPGSGTLYRMYTTDIALAKAAWKYFRTRANKIATVLYIYIYIACVCLFFERHILDILYVHIS